MAGLWSTGQGKITFYSKEAGDPQLPVAPDYPDTDSLEQRNGSKIDENLDSSKYTRNRDIFFLPQRPYMVLGTLSEQLLYPTWTEDALPVPKNVKSTGMHFLTIISAINEFFFLEVHFESITEESKLLKEMSYLLSK